MDSYSHKFFSETPPVRLFFKAAIPGVISMFAMSVYNIIEGIFVGQMIGGDAFAAMSLAMPFVMINFALSDMVGVGSSIPISIAHGQKDEKKANNIFSCAVIMIVTLAVLMGILMYFAAPFLIRLLGAEGSAAELAVMYLRINAIFSPFTTITFAMDNYLRISGFVRGSMFLNVFMSILQLVLLVLFVGVLRLGLLGSAVSINLAMGSCSIIAMIPFVRKKAILKFTRPHFNWRMIKQILTCGTPNFLNNIAGRLFSIVMNALLIRLGGTAAVSAYTVLMYAGDLVQPILYGLCDSMQPSVGYNWGARYYDRVKALEKCVFISCAVVSAAAIGVMYGFTDFIVSMFVDRSDTELFALSVHAMRLFNFKLIFWWFGFASQSFFNAIEKPKYSAVLSLSAAIVLPAIMVTVLWPLGLDGLWLNQTATYIPVAIIALCMLGKVQKLIKKENEHT